MPPVTSAFLPERSKRLGATDEGAGSMLDEGSNERFVCPWRLYLYQADAIHGQDTTEETGVLAPEATPRKWVSAIDWHARKWHPHDCHDCDAKHHSHIPFSPPSIGMVGPRAAPRQDRGSDPQ